MCKCRAVLSKALGVRDVAFLTQASLWWLEQVRILRISGILVASSHCLRRLSVALHIHDVVHVIDRPPDEWSAVISL